MYVYIIYNFLVETENINEPEKAEVERTNVKRNTKKKYESKENFVFKKPETPSTCTSPVT